MRRALERDREVAVRWIDDAVSERRREPEVEELERADRCLRDSARMHLVGLAHLACQTRRLSIR